MSETPDTTNGGDTRGLPRPAVSFLQKPVIRHTARTQGAPLKTVGDTWMPSRCSESCSSPDVSDHSVHPLTGVVGMVVFGVRGRKTGSFRSPGKSPAAARPGSENRRPPASAVSSATPASSGPRGPASPGGGIDSPGGGSTSSSSLGAAPCPRPGGRPRRPSPQQSSSSSSDVGRMRFLGSVSIESLCEGRDGTRSFSATNSGAGSSGGGYLGLCWYHSCEPHTSCW
mmetsp:Transcript_58612/g.165426  ORF Transcript_58612/g.165426 Transcript_58612/m.165426 type:complete len:227 (-) Transcript_58612:224-904(-)